MSKELFVNSVEVDLKRFMLLKIRSGRQVNLRFLHTFLFFKKHDQEDRDALKLKPSLSWCQITASHLFRGKDIPSLGRN
jgi:hypothetical protein